MNDISPTERAIALEVVEDFQVEAAEFRERQAEAAQRFSETIKMAMGSPIWKELRSIYKMHQSLAKSIQMSVYPFSFVSENCEVEEAKDGSVPTLEPMHNRSTYLTEYNTQLLERIVKTQESMIERKTYDYSYETKSFILWKSSWSAINFSTKSDTNNMSVLFETLYEALRERGRFRHGYLSVFVTREEILLRATQKGIKDANASWLKHTRSDMVNLKIPDDLKDAVIISEYDKEHKGYEFKIKIYKYLLN